VKGEEFAAAARDLTIFMDLMKKLSTLIAQLSTFFITFAA